MLEVLYSAALRVSALVGIDWQDINWTAREVRVLGKGEGTGFGLVLLFSLALG